MQRKDNESFVCLQMNTRWLHIECTHRVKNAIIRLKLVPDPLRKSLSGMVSVFQFITACIEIMLNTLILIVIIILLLYLV